VKLFVSNLPFTCSEDELREVFEAFGALRSVKIVLDRETGRSRGFGFVEFEDAAAGDRAIQELDGSSFQGRNLVVNVAHDKERQPRH